jgi:hypothetical protein
LLYIIFSIQFFDQILRPIDERVYALRERNQKMLEDSRIHAQAILDSHRERALQWKMAYG